MSCMWHTILWHPYSISVMLALWYTQQVLKRALTSDSGAVFVVLIDRRIYERAFLPVCILPSAVTFLRLILKNQLHSHSSHQESSQGNHCPCVKTITSHLPQTSCPVGKPESAEVAVTWPSTYNLLITENALCTYIYECEKLKWKVNPTCQIFVMSCNYANTW